MADSNLRAEIAKGAELKHAETSDKSGPHIEGTTQQGAGEMQNRLDAFLRNLAEFWWTWQQFSGAVLAVVDCFMLCTMHSTTYVLVKGRDVVQNVLDEFS